MRYTTEVLINLPCRMVFDLFADPENLSGWQPGLKSYKLLKGKPGEAGARTELIYEARKGELVMTETIRTRQAPEQFHMNYRARGVYNEVKNWFTEKEAGQTLWRSENYFRFGGMMKLMVPFMKKAFIHNTMLNMDRFKIFAEGKKKS